MKLVVFANLAAFADFSKKLIEQNPGVSIKTITPSEIVNWPRVAVQTSMLAKDQVELVFIDPKEVTRAAEELSEVSEMTIYWRGGKRDVLKGSTFADAMTKAGYGAGAVAAVDFYSNGDNHDYTYNTKTKEWDRKQPLVIG